MNSVDPRLITPQKNWAVILADPTSDRIGRIIKPSSTHHGETKEESVTEGTGTIIRVGETEKTQSLGLKAGDRVVYRNFLKDANPIETEERWLSNEGGETGKRKIYFLMSVEDIMAVAGDNVRVGVYSGSPASFAVTGDD